MVTVADTAYDWYQLIPILFHYENGKKYFILKFFKR